MLISAFIGHDWKRVYEHASKNNYRFLSFGDSSILTPPGQNLKSDAV
jgi:S-adenosylmethionine:tRNA ribosyltransferase-isomerase